MPERIQRKRTKGWRMPPNTRYLGRGSICGNPFKVGPCQSAEIAVIRYERWLRGVGDEGIYDPERREKILRLLAELGAYDYWACWCRLDEPCHCDVLAKLLAELEQANA